MHRRATIVTAVVTGVAIVLTLMSINLDTVISTFQNLHAAKIAAATLLLMLNFVLAYFRFRYTLSALGAPIDSRTAIHAFSLSTLANQFLLNVIGQSITRAVVLQQAGVPMSTTVVATYVERIIALGTLGIATLVAAFVLFGSIGFELHTGGAYFLSVTIGISATLGIAGVRSAAAFVTPDQLRTIASTAVRLIPSVILSIVVHAAMFSAYLVLALDFAAGVAVTKLTAAIVVVMFAASIPISWSGWGLREFSAAYVLNAVGMPSVSAVVIALTVGTLSLLVSLAAGLANMLEGWRRPIAWKKSEAPGVSALPGSDAVLFLPIGILTACLIYFQLRIPTGADGITANLADPLAITALFFAAYLAWRDGLSHLFARPVLYSVAGLAAVLVLGAIVAYFNFGLTQWVLFNRLFGFLILLGYATVASLVVRVAGERGRAILADTFVVSALLICAIQITAYSVHLYVVPLPDDFFGFQYWFGKQLEGYAQNPNAFAFQLLIAMCVLISFHPPTLQRSRISWSLLGTIAIATTMLIVRSRAGILTALAVAPLAILLQNFPSRLAINRKWALLGVFVLMVTIIAGVAFRSSLSLYTTELFTARWRTNAIDSDAVRWDSLSAALQQWLRYPLLGYGLGGFLAQRLSAGSTALVIHSVPVWFLADMGVVGLTGYLFFIFAPLGWGIARFKRIPRAVGVIAAVAIFVLMGLVHDVFYQRTFWFGLGLMLTNAAERECRVKGNN